MTTGLAERLETFNRGHAGGCAAIAHDGADIVVSLSGELDLSVSNDLSPLLDAVILECTAGCRLVLDLSHVTYIASMGVGLLASLMAKAERRSVRLVLRDIPPRVRKIMDALGLLSFFREEKTAGQGGGLP